MVGKYIIPNFLCMGQVIPHFIKFIGQELWRVSLISRSLFCYMKGFTACTFLEIHPCIL